MIRLSNIRWSEVHFSRAVVEPILRRVVVFSTADSAHCSPAGRFPVRLLNSRTSGAPALVRGPTGDHGAPLELHGVPDNMRKSFIPMHPRGLPSVSVFGTKVTQLPACRLWHDSVQSYIRQTKCLIYICSHNDKCGFYSSYCDMKQCSVCTEIY